MMRSPGLLQRDVQVILPLSRRLLIAFSHTPTYPYVTPLSTKHVDAINGIIAWSAAEAIVSWRAS